MRLESVRDLKLELSEPSESAAAVRARGALALGIAPVGASEYGLAVRVQEPDLVSGAEVEAISQRARGEVDVRYLGRIVKHQQPWQRTRQRPVLIGSSVGHFAVTAGSVGAFVRVRAREGARLLSNNHVLADENLGQPGDAILQPGAADGGRRERDTVGVLELFVALDREGVNEVDCALAALDAATDFDATLLRDRGELAGTTAPEQAGPVVKIGRTSGLTEGMVTAFEVDNIVVDYDMGRLHFDGQIEISGTEAGPFSEPGDSGSLIVTRDDSMAIGLLFAGSDQGGPGGFGVTYANPIGAVLDRLGAELWPAS